MSDDWTQEDWNRYKAGLAADERADAELIVAPYRALLHRAAEALKPFTVEKPIGIPPWWMDDFRRAAEVYAALIRELEHLS